MNRANRILALDREDMSDFERALFLKDLKRVTEEYFECNGDATLEIRNAMTASTEFRKSFHKNLEIL